MYTPSLSHVELQKHFLIRKKSIGRRVPFISIVRGAYRSGDFSSCPFVNASLDVFQGTFRVRVIITTAFPVFSYVRISDNAFEYFGKSVFSFRFVGILIKNVTSTALLLIGPSKIELFLIVVPSRPQRQCYVPVTIKFVSLRRSYYANEIFRVD